MKLLLWILGGAVIVWVALFAVYSLAMSSV